MSSVREALEGVAAIRGFKPLKEELRFLDGVWDDHDFGKP